MQVKYTLSDVFNEAQIPAVTFVPPKEFGDIVGSILTSGKHVTLCGPSGCGKTTLRTKLLTKRKSEPAVSTGCLGDLISNREHGKRFLQENLAAPIMRTRFLSS